MHEKLVNRLRKAAGSSIDFPDTLYDEAADIIEELDREYESIAESLNQSVELVRKLQNPRWIPVAKRLPEEWKPVLTYQPYKNDREKPLIRISWYIGAGIWRECEQANTLELPVTHWMPLPPAPEPPKEEK